MLVIGLLLCWFSVIMYSTICGLGQLVVLALESVGTGVVGFPLIIMDSTTCGLDQLVVLALEGVGAVMLKRLLHVLIANFVFHLMFLLFSSGFYMKPGLNA